MDEQNIYEVIVHENDISTGKTIYSTAGTFNNRETAIEVANIVEQSDKYLTAKVKERLVQIFDTREEYIEATGDKRAITAEEKETEKKLAKSALDKLTEAEKRALGL